MKFKNGTLLKVSTIALLLIATLIMVNFVLAEGAATYEMEVDGTTIILTPGMEVAQGTVRTDGSCDFSGPLVIKANPTEQKNAGRVTIEVTEDCALIVSDLEWSRESNAPDSGSASPASSAPGATLSTDELEELIGYVDSSVTDQINIEVNSVEAAIQYFDDGSEVWGGHSGFHHCSWLIASGWVKDYCTPGENPTGPNVISTWTEGEFHNNLCETGNHCETRHRGTFFTYPGDPRWHCTVYVIHPLLRHNCYGQVLGVHD